MGSQRLSSWPEGKQIPLLAIGPAVCSRESIKYTNFRPTLPIMWSKKGSSQLHPERDGETLDSAITSKFLKLEKDNEPAYSYMKLS
jgi:hypothetical protein